MLNPKMIEKIVQSQSKNRNLTEANTDKAEEFFPMRKSPSSRWRIVLSLQRKGLLKDLRKALNDYDTALRQFLSKRNEVVEVLVKIVKALPAEVKSDRWVWREIMRKVDFAPYVESPAEKSLRHLRRLARKLAEMVREDDPTLFRALARAYETGLLKLGDRLPHPRTDGVEREVSETLSKLLALYGSGHLWVLGKVREALEAMEAHWQTMHQG